jgi:hypothetical protein
MSQLSMGEGCGLNLGFSTSETKCPHWIEQSRYQTLREYKVIAPDRIEIICHDVLYCSFGGHPDHMTSIDPDGGPYLSIGKMIRSYQIKRIISYQPWKKQKDKIRIVLEVNGDA